MSFLVVPESDRISGLIKTLVAIASVSQTFMSRPMSVEEFLIEERFVTFGPIARIARFVGVLVHVVLEHLLGLEQSVTTGPLTPEWLRMAFGNVLVEGWSRHLVLGAILTTMGLAVGPALVAAH